MRSPMGIEATNFMVPIRVSKSATENGRPNTCEASDVIPVLRILAPWSSPERGSFSMFKLHSTGLEGLYLLVQLPPLLRRELYAVLVLIALISLVWLVRPSKMSQAMLPRPGQQMLVIGIRGLFYCLPGLSLPNIIGFVSLSQVLGF